MQYLVVIVPSHVKNNMTRNSDEESALVRALDGRRVGVDGGVVHATPVYPPVHVQRRVFALHDP